MTACIKLFDSAFFFLSSLVAIASRSKFQVKLASGTKSFLTGTLGGSGSTFFSSSAASFFSSGLASGYSCFFG
jgi:hypothetical protein